jgi:hypothetical protein
MTQLLRDYWVGEERFFDLDNGECFVVRSLGMWGTRGQAHAPLGVRLVVQMTMPHWYTSSTKPPRGAGHLPMSSHT